VSADVQIDFGDPRGLTDLGTYLGRARRANPEGAVRLLVVGDLLVATVAVIEGSGLMGEGTVLGMRVVRVAGSTPVDATVSFASVADRLARPGLGSSLSVPPVTVRAAWAALTPPRDGWEPVGALPTEVVESIARQGIEEIAEGSPEGSGSHAVDTLRRRVWGRMSDSVPPVAGGLAFGAHVLGFLAPGEQASVAAQGRWTRLSTSRGHVLVR
jgi:hypothetical protein